MVSGLTGSAALKANREYLDSIMGGGYVGGYDHRAIADQAQREYNEAVEAFRNDNPGLLPETVSGEEDHAG